jgi:hypothetical protein
VGLYRSDDGLVSDTPMMHLNQQMRTLQLCDSVQSGVSQRFDLPPLDPSGMEGANEEGSFYLGERERERRDEGRVGDGVTSQSVIISLFPGDDARVNGEIYFDAEAR